MWRSNRTWPDHLYLSTLQRPVLRPSSVVSAKTICGAQDSLTQFWIMKVWRCLYKAIIAIPQPKVGYQVTPFPRCPRPLSTIRGDSSRANRSDSVPFFRIHCISNVQQYCCIWSCIASGKSWVPRRTKFQFANRSFAWCSAKLTKKLNHVLALLSFIIRVQVSKRSKSL